MPKKKFLSLKTPSHHLNLNPTLNLTQNPNPNLNPNLNACGRCCRPYVAFRLGLEASMATDHARDDVP